MRTLRLRKAAQDDIEGALEWYREQSPTAALRFLIAVDEALESLRDQPERFPVVAGTLRRTLLRRFPYAVYFKVYERTISLGAYQPGVWLFPGQWIHGAQSTL